MSSADHRSVVFCIGNELIGDDAVGYEVYLRLAGCNYRVEYCGVGGIDLLPLLDGEQTMIVVDAVQLGAPPGTIHILDWEKLPAGGNSISAHGLGLRETIDIGRMLYPGRMPDSITLVGIEGRCFNRTREHMTPEVEAAVDIAKEKILALLQGGR